MIERFSLGFHVGIFRSENYVPNFTRFVDYVHKFSQTQGLFFNFKIEIQSTELIIYISPTIKGKTFSARQMFSISKYICEFAERCNFGYLSSFDKVLLLPF